MTASARRLAVALLQVAPGPAQRALEDGVGQRGQLVGHRLDRDAALDVAHQRAEDLGMVGAAQGVEQRALVGLAGAVPGLVALLELGGRARRGSKRSIIVRSSASSSITPGCSIR